MVTVTLERYMAQRRYWEVGLWALAVLVMFCANLGIVLYDSARLGLPDRGWELLVWEATSHAAVATLIPLVLLFDRLVPIRPGNWLPALAAHAGFSVVFSLLHVSLMYWARVAIYRAIDNGETYRWDNWWAEFGYEYLKDFRAYALLLILLYLYRFILRRLQGEAGFVAEGPEESQALPVTDRFLVKKLGREFLVRVGDIDWIEGSGNYVNLHVGKRVYPLRETMTHIAERLASRGFRRVHRSAVVNLDRIAGIVPLESGDGELELVTGDTVPVSRRYRKELRDQLIGETQVDPA